MRTVYHATLMRNGVQIDCTEIDENSERLAHDLFKEFGNNMNGTEIVIEKRIGE